MGFVLGVVTSILFIWACKELSKLLFRIGEHLDEKEEYNRYHDRILREFLVSIKDSLVVPEEKVLSEKERLLQANHKITQRKEIQDAMEKELGIF